MIIISGQTKDLGGFSVRRVLPAPQHRAVGPFVFFDHLGPADLAPGAVGINVRPHPHIGLATVTFLFDGTFVHRDSLGVVQPITAGDVNWMVAGQGVVHSERTAEHEHVHGQRVHGIQTWYALPASLEDCEPSFAHHPKDTLPQFAVDDANVIVVLGDAFGRTSPVHVPVATLYAMATLPAGGTVKLDRGLHNAHVERAVYVVSGGVIVDGTAVGAHQLGLITHADTAVIVADADSRIAFVGGAALDGPRHLEWNFVASSKERLAAAVQRWRNREFPIIETDAEEFIPY